MKKAYEEGARIEEFGPCSQLWSVANTPAWDDNRKYRIKDGIPLKQWEKHKDLIKVWWDGAIIQVKWGAKWIDTDDNNPAWCDNLEYRIKSAKKIDLHQENRFDSRLQYNMNKTEFITTMAQIANGVEDIELQSIIDMVVDNFSPHIEKDFPMKEELMAIFEEMDKLEQEKELFLEEYKEKMRVFAKDRDEILNKERRCLKQ